MKFLLLFLFITNSIFAIYVGNPALPDVIEEGFFFCKENWFAIKIGYQRDWVFDRYMKAVSKVSGRMDLFEFISDQGILTFNIIDRVELYGKGGATRISSCNYPTNRVRNEYQTHDHFLWGIGLRGLFLKWGNASFGADVACQKANPTLKWITTNGIPIKPRSGSKITYYEWQVGLGASYQINLLIPYFGVKYSNSKACFKHLPQGFLSNTNHFTTKNKRKFGMFIGSTITNGSKFSATVETRVIDEQSITLSGNVEF